MLYGNGYAYWGLHGNAWECDYLSMTDKNAEIGFDVFEIGAPDLHNMKDGEIAALKARGEEKGIRFSVNSGPSPDVDFASPDPAVRANALKWFTELLYQMEKLGTKDLIGAIYSFWPTDFIGWEDKEGAWERSIEGLQKLGAVAEKLGITISLEVLNRNESYILTDCAEAKVYCDRVGSPAVKILLDTYHMNIEEDNMYDAIRNCGDYLGYLHVGECNRKLPGQNNSIDWPEIGRALRDIGFDGTVVMEPFLLAGGPVGRDIRVWRDLSNGATPEQMDAEIRKSLAYLRECFEG